MTAGRDSVDEFLAQAARGSERESEVLPGDDERIERIERAVQRRYGAPARPRVRQVAVAVACGLLLTGVALAALRVAGILDAAPSPAGGAAATPVAAAKPANPAGGATPTPAAPSAASDAAAAASQAGVATPEATRPVPSSLDAPHTSSPRPNALSPTNDSARVVEPTAPAERHFADLPGDTGVTAASLFAAANSARVAGDSARSMQLSQQLLSQFPHSAEATSTHLSQALLLLRQGQPERALAELEAYDRSPGASHAEALWGKAQALQKLGRANDERAALRELVEKYPHAAYTAAAQKRLAVLP